MIGLEKIDYVINRTGASYEKVREALLESNGNVDEAIEYINRQKNSEEVQYEVIDEDISGEDSEETHDRDYFENVRLTIEEIVDSIKEIWRKGEATRLVIEKEGETILSLSLTISTIGLILAPIASIVGLSAGYLSSYDFKIIMENGEVVDIREYIKNKKSK